MRKFISFFITLVGLGSAAPFKHDLHLISLPGTNSRTMICMHGFGANYQVAITIRELNLIDSTLISFNFPDHDATERKLTRFTSGSIEELLPALYVMKEEVIEKGQSSIDLYGFSAGGGALVNAIAILNGSSHDQELQKIGIGQTEKAALLEAIQRGVVILDTPLKSVEEIIDLRGSTPELEFMAASYRKNGLRPIDSLEKLEGLSLNILLHFQEPDEILYNRDDELYARRIQESNHLGKTTIVMGKDGGHLVTHWPLWKAFNELIAR